MSFNGTQKKLNETFNMYRSIQKTNFYTPFYDAIYF